MKRRAGKANVIRQLAAIADGNQLGRTTTIEEYLQCPDWQLAATVLARALSDQTRALGAEASSAAPPAWLPPML
jgi:hypothetical protein